MGSSLTASLFLLPVVFWRFVAAVGLVSVKAKIGADVVLPCKPDWNKSVVMVEWFKTDQRSAPVLLYMDKEIHENQLRTYRGRVSLVDLETGDLSLVLKKMVDEDVGKYECRVELGPEPTGRPITVKTTTVKTTTVKTTTRRPSGHGDEVEVPVHSDKRGMIYYTLNSDPVSIVELTVLRGQSVTVSEPPSVRLLNPGVKGHSGPPAADNSPPG
ncbi:butyrophilin subfamily 2 member A1-like isoform X2 [Poecilia reticulata]|uniref:butyrophilin subfamily 2 member A1-like isoform X2 n=1 Tax=Poecilia reticulata TaxID=8081 RepID=UPI0004A42ABD|nr:PREDICTED: butyrophilin subfamily 2 member A1-like isoform X2 [Poecilia reticulata]XP_008401256.1 PREDICTED: butyrophilin subfamily 2 member A1-like isoform X2 [Poecilia reticulata]